MRLRHGMLFGHDIYSNLLKQCCPQSFRFGWITIHDSISRKFHLKFPIFLYFSRRFRGDIPWFSSTQCATPDNSNVHFIIFRPVKSLASACVYLIPPNFRPLCQTYLQLSYQSVEFSLHIVFSK